MVTIKYVLVILHADNEGEGEMAFPDCDYFPILTPPRRNILDLFSVVKICMMSLHQYWHGLISDRQTSRNEIHVKPP